MKTIKISILFLLVLYSFTYSTVTAQELHESWVLDKEKSAIEGSTSEWLVGMELVITLAGDNLKLEFTYQTKDNNFTDVIEVTFGAEAKTRDIMGRMGQGKATSQAQHDDSQQNVTMHTDWTIEGNNGTSKFSTDDIYSRSEDWENLILKRKTESKSGISNSTLIFKKKV